MYPFPSGFRPALAKANFMEALYMETVRSKGNLQNLVPIAVVVVGGCETCAEKMVKQALAQGSSWQDVDETLRILADMRKRECVIQSLGQEVVSRMEKPLAAGRRTLQQATAAQAAAGACGCTATISRGPA
jgi:alkylhydroperoxidase/carboxymuconolactone decarboxylase family protein YurZ